MRWVLSRGLTRGGYRVVQGSSEDDGLLQAQQEAPDLVIVDLKVLELDSLGILKSLRQTHSQLPVIVITPQGSLDTALQALKLGASDYIQKPFDLEELRLSVEKRLQVQALNREVYFLRSQISRANGEFQLIGNSPAIQAVRELIGQVANSQATVLLQGERGTGKEVTARALHYSSQCREYPFVVVNCATIPETLMESELFGSEKGALLSSCEPRPGRFELAHRGTMVLKDITTLSEAMQAKLLRFVEERAFERVGGKKPVTVDVRLVATTNKELSQAVREGLFREDLYYRLKVIPIQLPPLRQRQEDIPLLAKYFLNHFDPRGFFKGFSADALALFDSYPWPGNVRELANAIERAVMLCRDDWITAQEFALGGLPEKQQKTTHLPVHRNTGLAQSSGKQPTAKLSRRQRTEHNENNKQDDKQGSSENIRADRMTVTGEGFTLNINQAGISLEQVERILIESALERFEGNQSQAARFLSMTRAALSYRMQKLHIRNSQAQL